MVTGVRRFGALLAAPGAAFLQEVARCLEDRGGAVTLCADAPGLLRSLEAEQHDVVLVDVAIGERGWREAVGLIRRSASPPGLVIMGDALSASAFDDPERTAPEVIALPADARHVERVMHRALAAHRLWLENERWRLQHEAAADASEFVTQYAPLQAVLALAERVARSDACVLITGERGTGKTLLAGGIHRLSGRAGAPFVAVECAARLEEHLSRILFGDETGAAAEGSRGSPGLMELSSGGTLYLRDVDALGPRLQAMLLHVLELGWYYRPGGRQRVAADVRLLAASARDLGRLVDDGAFRSELYFRLNAVSIRLPPLRERTVDIALLARQFLERVYGVGALRPSDDLVRQLEAAPWPGNVRELRETMERAGPGRDGVLHSGDLRLVPAAGDGAAAAARDESRLTLREVERHQIELVLRHHGWHQGRAAHHLGISPKTLYRKIREYGLRRTHGG